MPPIEIFQITLRRVVIKSSRMKTKKEEKSKSKKKTSKKNIFNRFSVGVGFVDIHENSEHNKNVFEISNELLSIELHQQLASSVLVGVGKNDERNFKTRYFVTLNDWLRGSSSVVFVELAIWRFINERECWQSAKIYFRICLLGMSKTMKLRSF